MTELSHCPGSQSTHIRAKGAVAAAAPSPSVLRPLLLRLFIGAVAIGGVSAVGAFSMIAGLEGAHASPPPAASSVWIAQGGAPDAKGRTEAIPGPKSASSAGSGLGSLPQAAPELSATEGAGPNACPKVTADGKVILNRATVTELCKLPGIGPKRASAIVELRNRLKRFRKPAELLRVKGIGAKSLARMQPHFVLDDPASDCREAAPTNQ